MRPAPEQTGNVIREAFKPGTAPSDGYSALSLDDPDNRMLVPQATAPDADGLMRPGTGRFY
jgi:penicillin-binding protein 1A